MKFEAGKDKLSLLGWAYLFISGWCLWLWDIFLFIELSRAQTVYFSGPISVVAQLLGLQVGFPKIGIRPVSELGETFINIIKG